MSLLTLLVCLFGLTCNQVLAEQGIEAMLGGDLAKKNELKYHAFLYLDGRKKFCGAVIIDSLYVLTAAHCVVTPPSHVIKQRFVVVVGINDLNVKTGAIARAVETIYVHRHLNLTNNEHDIAVLKLQKELNLKDHHHRIAKLHLPKADHTHYEGVTAVVSGFGIHNFKIRRDKNGKLEKYEIEHDEKLRLAHAKVVSNAKCSEMNHNKVIKPYWICAQVNQRGHGPEGICEGDSGGPLVHGNEVIGILSTGVFNCDETTHPSVYIRVSAYTNIIHSIINGKPGHDVIAVPLPH